MQKRRIVITGMGLVSCFGTDVDLFYEKLLEGKSGITLIQGFPCEEYPTRFAGEIRDFDVGDYLDRKQARRVDPFIRYTMVAGKRALESAKITKDILESMDKSRAGIIIGSGMGGMSVFYDGTETIISKGYKRLTPFFVPFIITNMGGAMLSMDLGFTGPNYSISTACATANYCIIAAAQHIQRGEADLIVCGGTEAPINPIGLAGFVAIKALSQRNNEPEKASRPFDRNRDGFVMGEGSGVLVLESLEHALKRGAPIYAEYLGGSVSADAYHMTEPKEDGSEVARCILDALKNAQMHPEDVNYVNAHATATQIGDLCEIRGLKKAFGKHCSNLKVNATKSLIGHCLGAAAGIEAIVTIKAMQTAKLHPTINLEEPEPELEGISVVQDKAEDHAITAAISNSFGFGGHNSTIVLAPFRG
jgi:3-oxoacyl-[acyl-carrier-protein] synthase II